MLPLSGSESKSKRKGDLCQRLSVQLGVLAQRCCGFTGSSSSGGSSRSKRDDPSTRRGLCSSPACFWIMLLIQFVLVGTILSLQGEVQTLEQELGRASRFTFNTSSLSNWMPTSYSTEAVGPAAGGVEPSLWSSIKSIGANKPGGRVPPFPTKQADTSMKSTIETDDASKAVEAEREPVIVTPVSTSIVAAPSTPCPPSSSSSLSSQSLFWEWNVDSYEREKEIYTTLADDELKVTPEIVKSFREGAVEWHNLLPEYQHSSNGDLEFSRLVAGEVATTKYLTYDFNLHHHWNWGREHGPLKNFASCRKLNDKCTIHPKEDCLNNGLCGWCSRINMCVNRFNKPQPYDEHLKRPACDVKELEVGAQNQDVLCEPGTISMFEGGSRRTVEDQAVCSVVITDRWIDTGLNQNAGAMYYHFIKEHFEPWYANSYRGGKIADRYSHVVVTSGSMDHFHDYYGIFTRFCPRYSREMPARACFCKPRRNGGQAVIPEEARLPTTNSLTEAMVKNLGLEHVYPPNNRPALGLLSRENKRFILNELELARIAVEMGVSIKLLPLEYMTIYEQIREFRRLHFLTGIHGSGLTNYFLLHNNEAVSQEGVPEIDNRSDEAFKNWISKRKHFSNYCLQILPHMVQIGGEGLRGFANSIKCQYEEWVQPRRNNTVLHPHFLNRQEFDTLDALMSQGPQREDGAFFSFWVNQDTIIHPADWKELLKRMVRGG